MVQGNVEYHSVRTNGVALREMAQRNVEWYSVQTKLQRCVKWFSVMSNGTAYTQMV